MNYQTLFDFSNSVTLPSTTLVPALPLDISSLFLIAAVVFLFGPPISKLLFPAFLVIYMLFAGILNYSLNRDHADAMKHYKNGDFTVIEGCLSNYREASTRNSPFDAFDISNHRFLLSDFVSHEGYRKTSKTGTCFSNNEYYRVSYKGDVIYKIEILNKIDRFPK